MSANTSSTKDMKWYINCGITVALFFIIGMLPPFGQITPVGMKVLAAFVGMLYGWLTVGFAWPSMLGMLFLGLSGLTNTSVSSVLTSGWGNINACILVIMGFAFAAYLDACKLTDYIAAFFLTRKFILAAIVIQIVPAGHTLLCRTPNSEYVDEYVVIYIPALAISPV